MARPPRTADAPRRAPRARRRARLAAALALLAGALGAGCSSVSERWAEAEFRGVSYPVLYNVVLTTVDAEGFVVRTRDPQHGRFESDWIYGTSQRVVRGPSRRKVYARIEPLEPEGFLVRLRVAEEVIRKGGLMAVNVRESDDWEEFDDNYEDAEYLMARLMALVRAEGTPLPSEVQAAPAGAAVTP